MESLDLITIRDAIPDDKAFIFATWLRGLRYGNDFFASIHKGIYFNQYHAILERILTSGVTIKVACLKEDPSVILAYSVFKEPRLDWVFVKAAWRGIGLAKAIIPPSIQAVSHLTKVGRSILVKYPDVIFNPFDN